MAREKTTPKYFEGIGRRKSSVARVRIYGAAGGHFTVNDKKLSDYFKILRLEKSAAAPLQALKVDKKLAVGAKVRGGGVMSQAEAVRLGLSRALVKFNPELRKELKVLGYLTRDSRVVERKKFGFKKARRAPQWQKR